MRLQIKVFLLGILFTLFTAACAQENTYAVKRSIPKAANPASQKCIEDGYELRSLKSEKGVSSELYCFNPKNNRQCEEWAYFRNQCSLADTHPEKQ